MNVQFVKELTTQAVLDAPLQENSSGVLYWEYRTTPSTFHGAGGVMSRP